LIASLIRQGRAAKGYTQKELSELSRISVRSIQRIESGELIPRSYTLRVLAGILDVSFESFGPAAPLAARKRQLNRAQRWILSIGGSILLMLLAWAFLAQAARFPETDFERFLFGAAVLAMIVLLLCFVWREKS
jgi:transcriptional regulator with XRE-family HTH domain